MSAPRNKGAVSRSIRLPAIFAAVGVGASAVSAEPVSRDGELSTVVIVGVTPADSVGQSIENVAGAAQSASADAIDRSHATDLAEYLNRRLGSVYINENQSNPLQPDVNYRGFTASPLLGTPQGLSVYLDGVRLNQPFGDVVSWDLIPEAAIERLDLVSGGSPLFGINSLGGALSLKSKDGYSAPGASVRLSYGAHDRRQLEAETGGHAGNGLHWYATANRFRDDGWRKASPSDVKQAFAKFGWRGARTDLSLTGSVAQTDLTGNGVQDLRLLARDYRSVYTIPDETRNRSGLLNFAARHDFGGGVSLSGNAWYRNVRTATNNGDVNEAALGGDPYQPTAAERAALAAAGYSGFPSSGEDQSNTPFPRWRCIATALLGSAPDETCDGLIGRTALSQHNAGVAVEVRIERRVAGHENRFSAGLVQDESRAHFLQSAQFGYLNPDRSVTPVSGPGAFADGTQDSENAFDARVDLTGRTRLQSLYFEDSVQATRRLRVNVAARYDRSSVHNRDGITPGGGPGSLDGGYTFSRLNPAVGLVLRAAPSLSAYAGYSESSRAPSSIELGCADPDNPCRLPNAMAGDPPLDEVLTRTFEAGLRGRSGSALSWTAGVFRAENHDDILFVAGEQTGYGYFRNVGKTRRQGVELGLNGRAASFRYGAHYTYLDATFQSTEALGADGNSTADGPAPGFGGNITVQPGNRLTLVPRHLLKTYVEWQVLPRFALDAEAHYVGSQVARGNENGRHVPDGVYYLGSGNSGGYALLNLGGEWRPTSALSAWFQVSNLLDRRYATSAQLAVTAFDANGRFVARPFTAPVIDGERPRVSSTFVAPGAPRAFLLGVRYRFGG
jgi:outer membrane receptor protein involved in Fe transport